MRGYFKFLLYVEACFATEYIIKFGEGSVIFCEKDILPYVWVKDSVDIC